MKNEGVIDRVVRVFAGLGVLLFAWLGLGLLVGSPVGIVAAGAGAVLVVTGLVGFCPAYTLIGLRTCPLATKGGDTPTS